MALRFPVWDHSSETFRPFQSPWVALLQDHLCLTVNKASPASSCPLAATLDCPNSPPKSPSFPSTCLFPDAETLGHQPYLYFQSPKEISLGNPSLPTDLCSHPSLGLQAQTLEEAAAVSYGSQCKGAGSGGDAIYWEQTWSLDICYMIESLCI